MKKKIISIALSTVIATNMMTVYGASGLSDIGNSRYRDAIESIYHRDIMVGNENGDFRPSDTITRAEFAMAICRWKGLDTDGSSNFSDARGHWAEGAIDAVNDQGWMNGVSTDNFNPNGKMVYRDALKVLVTSMDKDDQAKSFGGYPRGYTYIAEKYGLTENVSGDYDAPIYRGAVAQIIENTRSLSNDDGELDEDRPENGLGYIETQENLETSTLRVRKDLELGTVLEKLPREVRLTLTSGKSIFVGINWDVNSTNYDKDSEGTYRITGRLIEPSGIEDPDNILRDVRATIEVVEEEADQDSEIVNYVERISGQVEVDFGTTSDEAKSELPQKVKLYMIGGQSREADIEWHIDNYNRLDPKDYKATGKIKLPEDVTDRLDVVKPLEYDLILREESSTLGISSVEMVSTQEYRIKTNRLVRNILGDTVKIHEMVDGSKGDIQEYTSLAHGENESELLVKLKDPLKLGREYKFVVKDSTLLGESGLAERTYRPRNGDFKIASIELEDNIIPAGEGVSHLIDFVARNSEGLDITDAIREQVTVRKNWDKAETSSDKALELKLQDGEVKHFYLEYTDLGDSAGEKTIRTDEKRIIGQTRSAQELVDWTISDSIPSWEDDENKYVQVKKAGSTLDLYLKVEDQFKDTEKLRATDQDIGIEIVSGREYIHADSKYDGSKLKIESFDESDNLYKSVVSQIQFEDDLSAGTYIDLRVSINNNISETIRIDIVEDSKISRLEANVDSINLSSSSELEDEDKSQTITINPLDQRGDDISLDGESIDYRIADNHSDKYKRYNNRIYRVRSDQDNTPYIEPFIDISEADPNYREAIEYIQQIGLVNGDGDGKYNPENKISRAEFATIITRILDLEPENTVVVDDVLSDHWSSHYITAVVSAGYMNLNEGKFYPDNQVKYQEALKTMVSIMDKEGEAKDRGEDPDGYPDGYIEVAEESGIAAGISNVGYTSDIQRQVFAQIIKNMFDTGQMHDMDCLADLVKDSDKEFTLVTRDRSGGQFDLDFYMEDTGLSVESAKVSVNIQSPGIVKNMVVEGFKNELNLSEDESLGLSFFEVDSNGIKVKRIDEDIYISLIDLSDEDNKIERTYNHTLANPKFTIGSDLGDISKDDISTNKVYRLSIVVGEIEILNENITIREL